MSSDGIVWDDAPNSTGATSDGTASAPIASAAGAPAPGIVWDDQKPAAPAPAPTLTRPGISDHLKQFGGSVLQGVGSTVSGLGRIADKVGDVSGMSNVVKPAMIAANQALPQSMQASPQTLLHPQTALGGEIGGAITGLGDKVQASESDAFKQEAAKPLFEGSLYQGSLMHPSTLAPGTLKVGAGLKSPTAIAANVESLAGQAAPLLAGGLEVKGAQGAEQLGAKVLPSVLENAPALVRKGAAAISKLANPQTLKTMGIGAAQFGEQAGAQEQQRIEQMTPEQLQAMPAYQQMVARGMSPADAQKTLAEQVHDQVFNKVAPLGALAGVTSALPLLEGSQGVLAKAVGTSRLKRAALGAALEAPTQGAMNVGMGAAQTAAANQVTGENRDPMENSGSEAVTGGLMGLGFGAAGGLRAHAAEPGSAADAAGVPPLPAAAPGSLTEVSQQIGGLRPNDAAAQAAGAPPLPGAPKPAASPNSQANRVPPEAPAWMNPQTGELGTPSRDDLVSQLASHMVQQHQATGDMRVNTQQLADAWGVTKSQIDKSRNAAVKNASDQIAVAERAAMNPPAAPAETGNAVSQDAPVDTATPSEAGTKASVPFMITQAMRSELRALGHTDADISGMTPAQAHATLKEGERVLGPARDLLGSSTEPAADAAVKETQAAQDAADAAAKEKAAADETPAPDNATAPEAAQPEANQPESPPVEAAAEPAKVEDTTPPADQATEVKAPEQATPDTTNTAAQEPADGATKPDSLPKESASIPATDVAAADGGSGSGGAGEGSSGAPAQTPEEKAATPRAGEPAPVAESTPAVAKADKAPFKVANAIRDAEAVRIKTPNGEFNGRTHVDQLVKNGYTKVESIRAGDKMVHRMVNVAGEREPIKARQLKYAQDAVAKHLEDAHQQIDAAAHEAATSPNNDKPEPTKAQKEAGNYELGHVKVHGMDVSIENPRGSTRSGVGEDGKPWSHEMSDHYGYVKGTVGADGEHVDAYVGAHPESKRVFVVDQIDQKTGKFDEHKAMIGFKSKRDAIQAYKSNFDPGWKVGPVKDMTVDSFKAWLKEGDTTKPLDQSLAKPSTREPLSAGQKRAMDLLGAGVGDTVRTTGMGASIQPGSVWKIDRIDKNGSVHISAPLGGSGIFTRGELESEVRKGATFEKLGTKEPQKAMFSKASSEDKEPFYSALTRSVAAGKGAPKVADATAWKQWMDGAQRRGEFKQAEREWLGVDQWLADQKGNVSREALQQYVLDNQVQVKETELGEKAPAKFSAYQLPGGDNYRELLLTLPQKLTHEEAISDQMRAKYGTSWLSDMNAEDRAAYLKVATKRQESAGNFTSNHFDQPNILAHIRFNDRTDADGKKVLFLEEVQSDWHQQGRREGYDNEAKFQKLVAERDAAASAGNTARWKELDDQIGQMAVHGSKGVPDAPLKKEWPMLAMKRMVRYAAENGFDKIGWTTGEQQAARYDLSKQVHSVAWEPGENGTGKLIALHKEGGRDPIFEKTIKESEIADHVGKDVAKKLLESPDRGGYKELSGVDLKVGGEGMQAFYDRMLPNEVNKWAKPFGAKVGDTVINGKHVRDKFTYTGPEHSLDAIENAMKVAESGGPSVYESPLTGEKTHFIFNRVANEAAIRPVLKAMRTGESFKDAVEKSGANLSPYAVKDIFGGTLKHEEITSATGVHSLDITPAMRKAALDGLPLFSFAGEHAQTADHGRLAQAKQMEAMGRESVPDRFGNQPGSPEDTHAATGWHRGVDGKWRFEIDDSAATVKTDALKDIKVKRAMISDLIKRRSAAYANGDQAAHDALTTRIKEANQAYESAKNPTLDKVLDHPALFAAYPDLAKVNVRVDPEMTSWGSYSPKTGDITIKPAGDYPKSGNRSLKSVLMHEIQHAIQDHEGFARGGSPAEARTLPEFEQLLAQRMMDAKNEVPSWTEVQPHMDDVEEETAHAVYRRLAGETEARNTQKRLDLSAEDRRATPPSETQDVSRGDQIVRFNGKAAHDVGDRAPVSQRLAEHTKNIEAQVGEIRKAWKGDDAPTIKVVPDPEHLPEFAKKEDGYERARGMYDGKTLYVVASAHPDSAVGAARLRETIAHEAVGHYGIDRIVTRELGAGAWDKIESSVARLEENGLGGDRMQAVLAEVRKRYGHDIDAATFARETLAVMAEKGVHNGLLDRAVAAIRAFIRRVMPDLKLSERELRQLLVKSDEYLRTGESYGQRVQSTQAMAFSRDGWGKDFPDAVTAMAHGELSKHPDYAAAKGGDQAAALRLARDVVTPEFVQKVRDVLPAGADPIIVPVVAREAAGDNEIPRMAAEVLAHHLGATADTEISQADKVSRGGSSAMHRLANQPAFDGKVEAGRNYVLLDDTLAQGGTLAQLKTHIEREGAKVVLATALTGKDYSRKLALDPDTLRKMRGRFGTVEGWWKQQFGHGFDGLTESEARAALTFDKGRLSADGLRNRVAAGKIPELGRVGEAAAGDRPGAEAPGSGGRVSDKPSRADFSKAEPEETNDRGEPDGPAHKRKPFSKASASIETMQEVMPKLDESAFQKAKDWAHGKLLDAEPHLLGALQLRHVLELAADQKVLEKPAKAYADLFQRMDGDRNKMTMDGAAKAERLNKFAYEHGPAGWAGKLTPEAKRLFGFMHEVTQIAVDPTHDYERLMMRDSRGEQMPWTKDLIKERIAALKNQMRGRSADDKTPMLDEIKDLRALPAREKARAQKYPELVAKWNALSPQAKEMFQMMREHYQETSDHLEAATLARIGSLDIPDHNKRVAMDMVKRNFGDQKVGGVYFPLARFGDYFIGSRSPDVGTGENATGGEYSFTKYESAAAALKAERQLKAAGHTIELTGKQNKDYTSQKPVTGTFMGQLTSMLRAGNAPDKVLDDIHQMFLKTLPELSLRKSGIHRFNVAGYTDNVPRVFASNVLHGAHQIAKARYGFQLENTLEQMKGRVEAQRTNMSVNSAAHADALLGELSKRHTWIMNPTNAKLATMVNSVGFAYYLAASPASALVNMSQGPMITLPVLGATHGWPAAMREMARATKDAMRTGGNIRRTLTTDAERAAFDTLEANGTFARTATHTLGGIAEGDALKMSPAYTKVMTAMGYLFQKAEVINRESAGMAAFRLATSAGKEFKDAVHYADQIVNGTHFDYSNANRARYMQGNVQKVLFQFKNYALGMSWVMYRNLEQSMRGETPEIRKVARRTLTGILGMTSLFAGVMGTPINNLLSAGANAYHAATGDDDEPWDFNTEFRAWLNDHLGETAGSLIADGAVNKLGANIAGRVGTGDLWFRDTDRELQGADAYDAALESLAGPIGGLVKNMYVGTQQVNEGHTERGIETMMPTAVKNAMKSMRFATQGVNSLRGDPIVPDVSGPQQFLQAIGFQPTAIRDQQRENSALMNYSKFITDRRQNLMNAYAMAQKVGDGEAQTAALARIAKFNQANPEVRITMSTLRSSLRQRARLSQQAENGIMLNRKLAARVKQEVGVQPVD